MLESLDRAILDDLVVVGEAVDDPLEGAMASSVLAGLGQKAELDVRSALLGSTLGVAERSSIASSALPAWRSGGRRADRTAGSLGSSLIASRAVATPGRCLPP